MRRSQWPLDKCKAWLVFCESFTRYRWFWILLAALCTSCLSVMMNGSSSISATEDLTVTVDLFVSFRDCCCVCMCFCAFLWLHYSEFFSTVHFSLMLFLVCFKHSYFYNRDPNALLLIVSLHIKYSLSFLFF